MYGVLHKVVTVRADFITGLESHFLTECHCHMKIPHTGCQKCLDLRLVSLFNIQ